MEWAKFNRKLDDALFEHIFKTNPSQLDTSSIWGLLFGPSSQQTIEISKINHDVAALLVELDVLKIKMKELHHRRKELDSLELSSSDKNLINHSYQEMDKKLQRLEKKLKEIKSEQINPRAQQSSNRWDSTER